VPFSYLEYKLCEKFGWTLQELDSQPYENIDAFMKIMNIEGQFEQRKIKSLEEDAKRRRY